MNDQKYYRPALPGLGLPGVDPGSAPGSILGGLGGAPAAWAASVVVNSGVKGLSVDQKTLQPGFRTAYFIDEIRISVWGDIADIADETVINTGLLGVIRAKFQTGAHAFSQRAVPIGLLAPRYSAWDWGAQIVSNGVTTSFGNVRWKLPVPLYMAPGDALQCMLDNDATYYAAALNVQVTYVGRIITQGAEAPEARAVPWVGWFEKLSDVPPVGSTDSWRNPFMHPLHVERLTCRVYDVRSVISTDIQATFDGMLPSEQFIGSTYMTIGLQDSLGYKIASCMGSTGQSVDTPIGAVFDPPRLAWTFQRPLAAREALEAVITNSDATIAGQLGQFGMVGYREEKT